MEISFLLQNDITGNFLIILKIVEFVGKYLYVVKVYIFEGNYLNNRLFFKLQ